MKENENSITKYIYRKKFKESIILFKIILMV